MKYKEILILILFIGIIFIIVDVIKSTYKCKDTRVIYKYIPRTYEEEMESPIPVTDIFIKMFEQPSPWVRSIGNYDREKKESINKYFISQI